MRRMDDAAQGFYSNLLQLRIFSHLEPACGMRIYSSAIRFEAWGSYSTVPI